MITNNMIDFQPHDGLEMLKQWQRDGIPVAFISTNVSDKGISQRDGAILSVTEPCLTILAEEIDGKRGNHEIPLIDAVIKGWKSDSQSYVTIKMPDGFGIDVYCNNS